jgi:S-adenosylmethionine:tRNA ribosyltransferase-isomerase
MKTSEFDYALPPGLIAQHPLPCRSDARMMVLHRSDGSIEHRVVKELPGILRHGDLLVVNDTRVIPARVLGTRADTGGRVEALFLEEIMPGEWLALLKLSGRQREGMRFVFAGGKLGAKLVEIRPAGEVVLRMQSERPLADLLDEAGSPPLPPYIRRPSGPESEDKARYQTVYARVPGAVAAPTAGMHFTPELLVELAGSGICRTAVTLHVGIGTFRPVSTADVESHRVDSERYEIGSDAADTINRTRTAGSRVVAVGTTTVRVLETVANDEGIVRACSGRTNLFIRPPHTLRAVDVLMTNFHLPKSTLLMLVCAVAGKDLIMRAYREAIEKGYRFYSYGDCMLIE